MRDYSQYYIDGRWQQPLSDERFEVVNPATGEAAGVVTLATVADVDRAVEAAKKAFESFSMTSVEQRVDILRSIVDVYAKRIDDVALAITEEMGAPYSSVSQPMQAQVGLGHFFDQIIQTSDLCMREYCKKIIACNHSALHGIVDIIEGRSRKYRR